MISKSEVIIVDKLHNNNIQYVYEAAISDDRGIIIHQTLPLRIMILV